MSLFKDAPIQLATIVGKYVFSGGCTDVIGGTMTGGVATNSVLLTFAPAFISAPTIIASVQAGIEGGAGALTASNWMVGLTGVTVSNAYVMTPSGSGVTVALQIIGEARL